MAKKKTDYHYVNDLIILKKKHSIVKHLQEYLPEPEIHGYKVWGSSFLIMDYLDKEPPKRGTRIMDVGCGWGLLGIYCNREYGARVTAVDADQHVFPYLDMHATLNEAKVKTLTSRYEELKPKQLHGQNIVVGGDICFWDELVDPLFSLVKNSAKAGVDKIIIADPGRSPFMKLARRCKKHFNAQLLDWDLRKPKKVDGYLLVVEP